jgi:hypothetical protein
MCGGRCSRLVGPLPYQQRVGARWITGRPLGRPVRVYPQSHKSAQRGDKPLEFLILDEQVVLDLQGFM